MYLLDTDICVWLIRGREPLFSIVFSHSPEDLAVASMTEAELLYRAHKGGSKKTLAITQELIANIGTVLSFDAEAAKIHAEVRLALHDAPITESSLMIASIALANRRTLVTGKVDEFSRVPGLEIESWF